jgi:hypothetical protein
MVNVEFDTFLNWFEGTFDNKKQVQHDPKSCSLVYVKHERKGTEFTCSYRLHRQKHPYRYFSAEALYNNGDIILKNPVHDIIFNLSGGAFHTNDKFEVNGVLYVNKAWLGPSHYHVMDQGFRDGIQLWGLNGSSLYEFQKSSS